MHRLFAATASLATFLMASSAMAGNVAKCEVVALLTVEDEAGGSASYRYYFPASDFLKSVYDPEVELIREQDGHPIEGITCERQDLMPDEEDYAILATGIPLVLSQDFDRPDTDVLTLYFAGDHFQYRYLTEAEIDSEFESDLNALLADFSGRDHGLGAKTNDTSTDAVEEAAGDTVELENMVEIITEDDVDPVSSTPLADELLNDPTPANVDMIEGDVEATLPSESTAPSEPETKIEPLSPTPEEPAAINAEDAEPVSSVTDLVFDLETGQLVKPGEE